MHAYICTHCSPCWLHAWPCTACSPAAGRRMPGGDEPASVAKAELEPRSAAVVPA